MATKKNVTKNNKASKTISIKNTFKARHTVVSFQETPSEGRINPDQNGEEKPSELFSLFTADIIKENVLFTR